MLKGLVNTFFRQRYLRECTVINLRGPLISSAPVMAVRCIDFVVY